ncbi:hypothetical protein APHAL10511_001229 [Amanita phalloides]|nr:hypothetical protein APHAL10511_001229 [Amanita phalloides]
MGDDVEPKGNFADTTETEETKEAPAALPEIPKSDLEFDISSIIGPTVEDRVKKRTSNILKLTEENERLKAELKAVTDRLEAAERRRMELGQKEQKIMEERGQ